MSKEMNDQLIIVEKYRSLLDSDKGLVTPRAFYETTSAEYREVDEQDFPNGKIFISQKYELVDEKFKDGELFFIYYNDIYESSDFSISDFSNKQKYWAFGDRAFPLDKNLLMPVLNTSLPSINNGLMENVNALPDKIFFIENNNYIYGPFQGFEVENEFYAQPITTSTHLALKHNYIAKYELPLIVDHLVFINTLNCRYVKNFKNLAMPSETVDFISDEKLIKEFSKVGFAGRKNLLGKNEAQKLVTAIDDAVKKLKVTGDNPRRERVLSMLNKFIDNSGQKENIIDEYFSDSVEGKKYLDLYLSEHKDQLITDRLKSLEDSFKNQQDVFEKKIELLGSDYDARKMALDEEIQEKKQKYLLELSSLREKVDEEKRLIEEGELNEKKTKLEQDVSNLEKEFNKLYNLKQLDDERKKLEIKKEMIADDVKKQEKLLEKTKEMTEQQKYFLQSPEIVTKALEFQTLQDLLSKKKSESSIEVHEDLNSDQHIEVSDYKLSSENKEEYIYYLTNKFNDIGQGCQMSAVEVANILLSITQSFLTVFSGAPGTGKTSSVYKIAESLGLEPYHPLNNNLLNISVGRAWVSSRDLLGFYNPLNDRYQVARAGLYPFLKKDSAFLKLVLLDEANLSSMEHYWSDFLSISDFGNNKRIDTGIPNSDDRYLDIHDTVRFIATINNDATTERLSPRLIDRAPIIYFNNLESYASQQLLNSFTGAITAQNIIEQFSINVNDAVLNTQQRDILEEIVFALSSDEIRAPKIRVSPRKKNSIAGYCQAAEELEGIFTDENQAIDYAIAQHVLPLIEGFGIDFKERLLKVKNILETRSMKKSLLILEEIIIQGEYHSDSYSFF